MKRWLPGGADAGPAPPESGRLCSWSRDRDPGSLLWDKFSPDWTPAAAPTIFVPVPFNDRSLR